MIKICLSQEEKDRLLRSRKQGPGKRNERVLFVLLSAEGKSPPEISRLTKRHVHTIRYWLHMYIKHGMKKLIDRERPGRPPLKREEAYAKLKEVLPKSPDALGYIESSWTSALAKDYLEKQELSVSRETIKRAFKKHGLVFKRLSKCPPRVLTPKEKKTDDSLASTSRKYRKIQTKRRTFIYR